MELFHGADQECLELLGWEAKGVLSASARWAGGQKMMCKARQGIWRRVFLLGDRAGEQELLQAFRPHVGGGPQEQGEVPWGGTACSASGRAGGKGGEMHET